MYHVTFYHYPGNDLTAFPNNDIEEAFIAAEQHCASGGCFLPETQHLQIRVCKSNFLLFLIKQIITNVF